MSVLSVGTVRTRRRLRREKGDVLVSGNQGQLVRMGERVLGIQINLGHRARF